MIPLSISYTWPQANSPPSLLYSAISFGPLRSLTARPHQQGDGDKRWGKAEVSGPSMWPRSDKRNLGVEREAWGGKDEGERASGETRGTVKETRRQRSDRDGKRRDRDGRTTVFVILASQKYIRPRSWRNFHVLIILKTSKWELFKLCWDVHHSFQHLKQALHFRFMLEPIASLLAGCSISLSCPS